MNDDRDRRPSDADLGRDLFPPVKTLGELFPDGVFGSTTPEDLESEASMVLADLARVTSHMGGLGLYVRMMQWEVDNELAPDTLEAAIASADPEELRTLVRGLAQRVRSMHWAMFDAAVAIERIRPVAALAATGLRTSVGAARGRALAKEPGDARRLAAVEAAKALGGSTRQRALSLWRAWEKNATLRVFPRPGESTLRRWLTLSS